METYLEQAIKFKQEIKMNLIHKYSNQIRNIFNKHLQNPTLQSAVSFGIIF